MSLTLRGARFLDVTCQDIARVGKMSHQHLYVEGMQAAYYKTISKARQSDSPDVIGHVDVKASWSKYRSYLLNYLESPHSRPDYVEVIDKPKNRIAVRPIARFDIRDRLVYETLVYSIADTIDAHVPQNVFSSPWKRPGLNFWYPVNSWLSMHRVGYQTLRGMANGQLARTDIVSFYENIDIGTLRTDLDTIGANSRVSDQIAYFLDGFQQTSHAWGLPQGCDASGILANLYLLPIDELIQQTGISFLRYSDDMLLFDDSWESLRDALLQINGGLRERRMAMSSTKTQIFDREASTRQLDNTIKDAISYGLRAGFPGTLDAVNELLLAAVEGGFANDRDIKFSLRRLAEREDPRAIDWVLERIFENHHLCDDFFDYLSRFPSKSEDVCAVMVECLETASPVSYSHLTQKIFQWAIRMRIDSSAIKRSAWLALRDRNVRAITREFAARYIGCFGKVADGQLLKAEFSHEATISIRRAILIAMHERDHMPRSLLQSAMSPNSELRWIAEYLAYATDIPDP